MSLFEGSERTLRTSCLHRLIVQPFCCMQLLLALRLILQTNARDALLADLEFDRLDAVLDDNYHHDAN